MKRKFNPSFKQKDKEQFYYNDGLWIKCKEEIIANLWGLWVISKNADRYVDDEGFLVFGNYEND